MSRPLTTEHTHLPIYRVVRKGREDPLDTSFSQRASGNNRWNTPQFPALYCCCSERVARAVTLDVFRLAGMELTDLQPNAQPQLVELSWSGPVIDMVSPGGIHAAGFPADYPERVTKEQTRKAAATWHENGALGVVCRSASLSRQGFSNWIEPHPTWGELAVFVTNNPAQPRLLLRREDLGWFVGA